MQVTGRYLDYPQPHPGIAFAKNRYDVGKHRGGQNGRGKDRKSVLAVGGIGKALDFKVLLDVVVEGDYPAKHVVDLFSCLGGTYSVAVAVKELGVVLIFQPLQSLAQPLRGYEQVLGGRRERGAVHSADKVLHVVEIQNPVPPVAEQAWVLMVKLYILFGFTSGRL